MSSFLIQYGWIVSLIGLCLNILILFFCRKGGSLKSIEKSLDHLFRNENICALLTQFFVKSGVSEKELLDSLKQLLDYIKGGKK